MTRLSRYLLPTEKEAPADAEAISHKLMVRAGLVRQLGAGMWTYLPAGWRAHRRAEQIVREEMNAIGAHEMLMPVLQPAELWRRSGRYSIEELFKLQDRRGADLVLAMTHEEALTFHVAREIRSYRDLPLLLYHFQVKERDEPRPRAGVLRTREFIMKDSYSFDRDQEGLNASYDLHAGAYDRIFDRAGLEWYRVESDVGMMGGFGAHEYMAPCAAGENEVALSSAGYAANVEIASATPKPVEGLPAAAGRARSPSTRPARPRSSRSPSAWRPGGGAAEGAAGGRRRRLAAARARSRRPPSERDQAARTLSASPARQATAEELDAPVRRPGRLHRARGRTGAGPGRRGAARA